MPLSRDPQAMPASPTPAPAAPPAHDSMRRLQIGIAGVLTVLLLVGMADLIGNRAREDAAKEVVDSAEVKMPGAVEKSASAPLEELGVQPVSKDENAANTVKVPQTVPTTATVPDLEPDPELERARQSKQ